MMNIEKFDDAVILIDADDKLFHEVNAKNVVILISCVTKGAAKFKRQIFSEEVSVA